MRLIMSNPLQEFYRSIGKSPVKTLQVASPFITNRGIQSLVKQFRRKRTRVQLIANLSELNVALSLSNPVTPLLEIREVMGDRIEIKSHPMLHAKMYLLDGRAALVGSSNLTYGGMERNVELNLLISGRKSEDIRELGKLATWYHDRWEEAGKAVSKKQLLDIERRWLASEKSLKGIIGRLIPEPRLGGNGWDKVRAIARRKSWKMEDISDILSEKDDGAAKNTNRKLIFLKNLDLIEFDEKSVYTLRKVSSRTEMFTLLEGGYLGVSLRRVLQSFHNSKSERMSYQTFSEEMEIPSDDEALHVSVIWLESLGYIVRHYTRGVNEFSLTKISKEIDMA